MEKGGPVEIEVDDVIVDHFGKYRQFVVGLLDVEHSLQICHYFVLYYQDPLCPDQREGVVDLQSLDFLIVENKVVSKKLRKPKARN